MFKSLKRVGMAGLVSLTALAAVPATCIVVMATTAGANDAARPIGQFAPPHGWTCIVRAFTR